MCNWETVFGFGLFGFVAGVCLMAILYSINTRPTASQREREAAEAALRG